MSAASRPVAAADSRCLPGEIAAEDFVARAEARLAREPPGPCDPTSNPRGDHSLDPEGKAVAPPGPHRRAAVLVPIVPRSGSLSVLLTKRAPHLRDHSGQIAFPGGKIDPDDETPRHAALREAEEEIGLAPDRVRVLGYLDPYLSATGFLVAPVVGLVDPEAPFAPNPSEVAEIFEVPLAFLMDPSRYALNALVWKGRLRHYYAVPFGERMIWGLTAGILHNLHQRLCL
ncbi:CoA pyrophosphatase [Methylobacterium oxalidis]|uniref:Coenzyme A pyrophosphatase n=1 Tax=Methylobacterium oxalidis TaxID=944322 RepID=A0A512IWA7_9HYPH|nr:CoA pyrophosphatase [Methylobacterium oxalidis]GEP01988.1 coenzyme A pyrophosphatase [Methylobacterium oxalidis]GJE30186.1 putative Nudix hydrolase NudL [Methylobacterium oxalidis]GLS61933.1 coenzyme A pyrophosphatase [Methylobacterium oxalidis]